MRLVVLSMCLFLSANLLSAEEKKSESAGASLSQEEAAAGFVCLFDGKTLNGWQGAVDGHAVHGGLLVCEKHGGGNLFTAKEYGDFIFRFEYKLAAGGNNGVGIRATLQGNPAYTGMEIQILDDDHPRYAKLKPFQYNGSVYGAVASERGHMKPVGQWNAMEIKAKGSLVTVTLNGAVIVDTDLSKVGPKSIHGGDLKGLHSEKGHIGFCGHGHRIEFRNIRVKEL